MENNAPEDQKADQASDAAQGSVPPLPNKFVALEGRLEMERHPHHPPVMCNRNCETGLMPYLCGIAHRHNGAASVMMVLESTLEALNGKYVRITFETEAPNSEVRRGGPDV